eukprot:3723999-Rhodomonas_salina.2
MPLVLLCAATLFSTNVGYGAILYAAAAFQYERRGAPAGWVILGALLLCSLSALVFLWTTAFPVQFGRESALIPPFRSVMRRHVRDWHSVCRYNAAISGQAESPPHYLPTALRVPGSTSVLRARYKLSGTELASGVLRTSYKMPSTKLAYGATRRYYTTLRPSSLPSSSLSYK